MVPVGSRPPSGTGGRALQSSRGLVIHDTAIPKIKHYSAVLPKMDPATDKHMVIGQDTPWSWSELDS